MKIIYAALMHESNTFSAKKTTLDVWRGGTWVEDPAVVLAPESGLVTDGMRRICEDYGVELVAGLVGMLAGPTITAEC